MRDIAQAQMNLEEPVWTHDQHLPCQNWVCPTEGGIEGSPCSLDPGLSQVLKVSKGTPGPSDDRNYQNPLADALVRGPWILALLANVLTNTCPSTDHPILAQLSRWWQGTDSNSSCLC